MKKIEHGTQQDPQRQAKLWTPNFIFICLASFCNAMAFQSLIVSLPLYIQNLGGTTSISGLALATLTLSAVIIRPFAGLALDTYGRNLIFITGLLLFLLPSIIFIFMVPRSGLLILRFVQGFGWGISHTSVGTIASDIVPTIRLGEGMGTFNVSGAISFALAPLMTLAIIHQFSFRTLFVVISLLTVMSVIFAQVIKYPKFEPSIQKRKLELFSKEALQPALVVLFTGLSYSAILSFLALFTQEKGIVNPGLFFTFLGVTTIISRPLSGRLLDRLGQKGFDMVLIAGVPMMAIALWMVASTSAVWQLAVSGAMYGIGTGTIQSAMLAMCIKKLPTKRGLANAMYGTSLDLGVAIGSIIWGIVANLVGFQVMFRLTTIPVFLCLLVYFVLRPRLTSRPINER